jgi:hypothetical protein
MKDEDIIELAIKSVLMSANGAVPKKALIFMVEQHIGRKLTEVEKGLGIWNAREAFLHETKVEIKSKNGTLTTATTEQSIRRRRGERSRALRTLARSVKRATQLAQNDHITDEQRRNLEAAADKANTMLIHATASLYKKSLPKPKGL